ncbi:hypothetical protein BCR39DRAFT_511371 [Naematelia encephala]|uniref:Mitochondrial ATPase inhibitor, IATP-domain-containing protein n=1 Tax=Naematelia encephala TaxID=71784 RepID=A0A1Y2BLQ1_9TREE|nr:hypothetical protein BCR39DRAFT_511371 [Naematelia encephala]
MSAIRAIRPARLTALRAPIMFSRNYAPDVRPEGTTGTSKGFRDRENAEEGQYIRRREQERLKEAKEKLEKAQAEYDAAHKDANKEGSK